MFIDQARITVSGGAGGNGCCSFRREKYVPLGGPDGGDGGKGGDVYIVATSRLSSLLDRRYHPHSKAERGMHGKGSDMHGRSGADIEIPVPLGTLVKDQEAETVLADLTEEGQRYLAAQGGRGGRGNARFSTSTNRAPKFCERGEPGEQKEFLLELKLIAEVGIVGKPNAGKSTFLARISAARPKIAEYPFTTLSPNLGVVDLGDFRTLTVADIPGIIEGAAEGKGLGHDFLRHIERTRVLLFLIDLGDPDPKATLDILENELRQHSLTFANRQRVFALNKLDVTENRERAPRVLPEFPGAFLISAATGEGVPELLEALWEAVERARREEPVPEAPPTGREYTFAPPYTIHPAPGGFRVEGDRVLRAVRMTDFDNPDAVRHLHRTLEKIGLFKALKRVGAKPGQSIHIGDTELEYNPDE
ncbi:MAG: GTPase ObgE [Candidatus Hydrogenedentes bacterium]|nr:GTPase ObgE [Candidatus Hydrogenedentota bacterium]